MAIAWDRSMNAELLEGATDRTVRKMTGSDRGGIVDPANNFRHIHATGWVPALGDAYKQEIMRGIIRGV